MHTHATPPSKRPLPGKFLALVSAFFLALLLYKPSFRGLHAARLSITTTLSEPYDPAYLLNVPSFVNGTLPSDGRATQLAATRAAVSLPRSLVARYLSIPSVCARVPFRPHLRAALAGLRVGLRGRAPAQIAVVQRNATLLVHLAPRVPFQTNATSLTHAFIAAAVSRASRFGEVVLLPEALAAARDARRDTAVLARALEGKGVSVRVVVPRGPDEEATLMHAAANLLVHRGRYSALGALVCGGVVYYTEEMGEYMDRNEFRWLVGDGRPAVDGEVFRYQRHLDAMGRVQPSCCRFEPFGKGDGQKIVCANARAFEGGECWIVSLGCNGHWSFEREIVRRTGCRVETFDCTGTWDVPKEMEGRVRLHKLCIGERGDAREDFIGWREVRKFGKGMPALVKMDVEGYEFPVMREVLRDEGDAGLPEQLAMEMHSNKATVEEVAGLFRNLSVRGYHLVHRADNPFCRPCSEVTLVRKTGLPPVQ